MNQRYSFYRNRRSKQDPKQSREAFLQIMPRYSYDPVLKQRNMDMNTNIGGGVDRITELPECIIHHIMSRLPTKAVAATSVLSKTWYQIWKNYPFLEFSLTQKNKDDVVKSLRHFSQHKISVRSFHVSMGDHDLYSHLDTLITLALENGVQFLRLTLYGKAGMFRFTLPQPVFSSKSLTYLWLSSCFLDQPLSALLFRGSGSPSPLKELCLQYCGLDASIVLNNADCCPCLEYLGIIDCMGFKSVYISNLVQLHTLELYLQDNDVDVDDIVIASQSIQCLTIRTPDDKPWSIVNINGCHNLKSLCLQSMITDSEIHSLLSMLPLLQELYLFYCEQVTTINISTPRLRTLLVCPKMNSNLEFVRIEAPNLISLFFLPKDRHCVINMENCCNLQNLIVFSRLITEPLFHNLVSQFPLLQNLWISGCQKLQRIEITNLELKRLHIVRCLRLEAVKVDSPNLSELCCTGREIPEFSVAVAPRGGLKFERDEDHKPLTTYCESRLRHMLEYYLGIKDESLINRIVYSAIEYLTKLGIYTLDRSLRF